MEDHKLEEHMILVPQVYPQGSCVQKPPSQGEGKAGRRRRKRNRGAGEGKESSGAGARKRKLSEEQVNLLEVSFGKEQKLESERKERLASELGLDSRQVAVWFQNRRARWKNKKLEDEYSKLKTLHDHLLLDKCHLHSQVLKLKEQLSEAEKEIQRLGERLEGMSSNSSSSSVSVEAIDAPFFGDFVPETEYDINPFYMMENNYIPNMEWVDLYV